MNIFERFDSWVEKLAALPRAGRNHRPLCDDFRNLLGDCSVRFDAVYADPPYTRDHYSRYYHVLETMARHDEPEISMTMIRSGNSPALSRGMYRTDRHQSPFCIKSQAPGAFCELFEGVKGRKVPLVLSYSPYSASKGNRPRLLTVDELTAIASRYFSNVECRLLNGISHNKLNIMERNKEVRYDPEVLLVCLP